MHCQRVVLVGDAHLGRGSPAAEVAFLAFLDTVPALGDGLVITGDLFEFWFAYSRVVPRRGARVAAALAHLRRAMPVLLVGGNHDRWAAGFWQEAFDIEFHPLEARLEVGGRPALVVHGDGVTDTQWTSRALHGVLGHPATAGLYRALHPDLGFWLVDRLSGYLGDRSRTPEEIHASATRQDTWARSRLEREPGLGLLVMGHTHRAAVVATPSGQLYVNPGAWFDGYRYALVTDGTAVLTHFSP